MRFLISALLAAIGATLGLLWLSRIPLGVPAEWTWLRHEFHANNGVELTVRFGIAGFFAIVFGWTASAGYRASRHAGRVPKRWLALLMIAAIGWSISLQQAAPPLAADLKPLLVLYDPGSSGYFTEAQKIESASRFLGEYETWIRSGDATQRVLHQGTHPPGLVLLYIAAARATAGSELLVEGVLLTLPERLRMPFLAIAEAKSSRFAPEQLATLWSVVILTQILAFTPMIGLSLLAPEDSPTANWTAAVLWPLIPALHIFIPKSDVLYVAISSTALVALSGVLRKRSWLHAAVLGATLWIGLCLSLAFLVLGFLVVLAAVIWRFTHEWTDRTPTRQALTYLSRFGIVLAVFVGLTATVWWTFNVNLVEIWRLNWLHHAEFYSAFTRTYARWLPVNVLELAFALGLPIFVLAGWGLVGCIRTPRWDWGVRESIAVATACTWGVLWLSGKNMGEAARLWLFLMPGLVLAASRVTDLGKARTTRDHFQQWPAILVAQAICCAITVLRVSGFHFVEWMQ